MITLYEERKENNEELTISRALTVAPGYVTDPFAFVTLDGSVFWMLRSDTRAMGRDLSVTKAKGSVTYPVAPRRDCNPTIQHGVVPKLMIISSI